MARVLTSGFEIGTLLAESSSSPSATNLTDSDIVTTDFYSGLRSLKVTPASGVAKFLFYGISAAFVRFAIKVTVRPASTARGVMGAQGSGSNIQLNADGTLALVDVNTVKSTSATALTDTTRWYVVQVDTSNLAAVQWWIDGASQGTTTLSGGILAEFGANDTVADTYTAFFDDIALNDATGGSENGLPSVSGRVVLLVPTADSAKGTGWTNDAAGASNFFDAVDNKPPAGIADTTAGSGLHQIRNATANASSNYDATMTSYVAAGVPNGSVINVIDPIVATAAPVTTSSKQGTVGVVSNPAITNVALGAGGTAGAFWSGVAAGTYPTGWKLSHGTVTYAPSVTPATAPVMRITQVTSSTRIAMVCFMGMYVDYTPPSFAKPLSVRQAVQRAASW